MNRIISEELYQAVCQLLRSDEKYQFGDEFDQLIKAPVQTLQPPSGQVGEAFEAGWNAAYKNMDEAAPILSRAKERYLNKALRQPVETVSPATQVMREMIDRIPDPALRTLPQAPVVEVPSLEELRVAHERGWAGLENDHDQLMGALTAIHALLQSKGGLG